MNDNCILQKSRVAHASSERDRLRCIGALRLWVTMTPIEYY